MMRIEKNRLKHQLYGKLLPRGEIPESWLIAELKRLAQELGFTPQLLDMDHSGAFSSTTYRNHFGTWNNAIRTAGLSFLRPPKWSADQVSPENGSWIAGFVDGEASFYVGDHNYHNTQRFAPLFRIALRSDDIGALQEVKRILDLPHRIHLQKKRKETYSDVAILAISNLPTLIFKIVPLFQRFPLRSKKRKDFELFTKIVGILRSKWEQGRQKDSYTTSEVKMLSELQQRLREIKKFDPFFSQLRI